MVSNPYNQELKARKAINKILTEGIKDDNQISLTCLIKEILLTYPVSEQTTKKFIINYYVNTGDFNLKDDLITKNKELGL